jgi:hypothetical protein
MTRRGRIALIILVPLLLLLFKPVSFIVRVMLFPHHFGVVSIAKLPPYQEPGMLAKAWALPAARTFGGSVDYQTNPSTCGPTSLANVERSLGMAGATTKGVLSGSGLCWSGTCLGGLTLEELAGLARRGGLRATILRGLTLDEFRALLLNVNDPGRRYIINFNRGQLFDIGGGHFSPLAGYLQAEDQVLVLDVNAKFRPWLAPTERLFQAMDTIDSSTGQKRGLLLIER